MNIKIWSINGKVFMICVMLREWEEKRLFLVFVWKCKCLVFLQKIWRPLSNY